mgnify:CR=1 FL=1
MGMSFGIASRTANGIEILTLHGRLVLGDGTGQVRAAVQRALAQPTTRGLVLDLSGLAYMDSAGLGELVGAYASAAAKNRALKLLRPHERIGSLLQVTKLYSTFDVFPDEAAALASFAQGAE